VTTYPLGACRWIWTSPFSDADAGLAAHVAQLGFDVLEVCVEDPDLVHAELLREAGESAGIAYSVCGAYGPDRDLAAEDPGPRESALAYTRRPVEIAAGIGAPHVCGPMYSAVGKARGDDPAAEWRRAVEGLKRAAEHGVRLAAEQGLELCAGVGSDAVGLLLDTYHLNIEEKSPADAIRLAGDRLFHFHACENDWGTPGTGHIEWEAVIRALRQIRYEGQLVIESFTPQVQAIARAVSLWRPLDAEGDAFASAGLRFLRSAIGSDAA
jgi:D-psicose/D-tagatose/L-ribulose 3-epimerase